MYPYLNPHPFTCFFPFTHLLTTGVFPMSTVPTALVDGLNGLAADADDVTSKGAAKAVTAAALATAETSDANAGHDLTASAAKQQTDLSAFITLLETTYGPPPAPPAKPPAVAPGT